MRNGRTITTAVYLAVFIALVDQLSKWWLLNRIMDPPRSIFINSYFNLVLVWNKGVTFGMFSRNYSQYMPYVFVALAFVILFLLLRWLRHTTSQLVALALGLVMGGAVGNVIDRLYHGAVVDFLDFHATVNGHTYTWPSFNIADSAIVLGVGLLLIDSLARRR